MAFGHGFLKDVIKSALVSTEIPALLEPAETSRDDLKRPSGLFQSSLTLVSWVRGRASMWDASYVDTLASIHIIGREPQYVPNP